MFNGPSRDSVLQGVGPFFSTINARPATSFDGNPITEPRLILADLPVGAGQQMIFSVAEDFDAPALPTDVKWIDVGLFYRPSAARFQGFSAPGTVSFGGRYVAPTELVSSRDPRFPGTQIAERRWRIARVPVAADPDNAHPFGTLAVTGDPLIAFEDKAISDILTIYVKFIALDRDADPIVAADKTFNIGYVFGGFARG